MPKHNTLLRQLHDHAISQMRGMVNDISKWNQCSDIGIVTEVKSNLHYISNDLRYLANICFVIKQIYQSDFNTPVSLEYIKNELKKLEDEQPLVYGNAICAIKTTLENETISL
jgi:hypothetical protein